MDECIVDETACGAVPPPSTLPQGTALRKPFPIVYKAPGSQEEVIPTVKVDDVTLSGIRSVEGQGTATRRAIHLPWLDPATSEWDRLLKHSLVEPGGDDVSGGEAVSCLSAVPDAYFAIDHDFYKRIQTAAISLHKLALQTTAKIIACNKRSDILVKFFNIPADLHAHLEETFATQSPACGRFDMGYDGKHIVMFEYNCDSSAALLEASETQEKMLQFYGIVPPSTTGSMERTSSPSDLLATGKPFSAGAVLLPKLVNYFKKLFPIVQDAGFGSTIHFMVDNDDEEKYTAQVALECAGLAGFKGKVIVGLEGLRFEQHVDITKAIGEYDTTSLGPCPRRVYDLDGVEVKVVWKTWSWDTVLKDHRLAVVSKMVAPSSPVGRGPGGTPSPRLSDVLLNKNIRVFEPFWKAVAGSKALLPTMYALDPTHENMCAAAFEQTEFIKSRPYLSKPVSGRAGQNIVFMQQDDAAVQTFDCSTTTGRRNTCAERKRILHLASENPLRCPEFDRHEVSAEDADDGRWGIRREQANLLTRQASWGSPGVQTPLETSDGKFHDTVQVYQHRLRLRSFEAEPFPDQAASEEDTIDDAKHHDPAVPMQVYPIFCAWMVDDQFGAVCVREDTSRITKLASMVVPCVVERK